MALAAERPAAKLLLFVRRDPDTLIGDRQDYALLFISCANRDRRAGELSGIPTRDARGSAGAGGAGRKGGLGGRYNAACKFLQDLS